MKIILNNLDETRDFGIRLGSLLREGDLVSLVGDLGAGKTTLSKSIGLGLGVKDYITSPTFALINEYEGRLKVYHFDVYRLENADELDDLGFDDYFYGRGVSLVEWGEKIKSFLPESRLIVSLKRLGENSRELSLEGLGERYESLIKELE